jgi:hypothetical protein
VGVVLRRRDVACSPDVFERQGEVTHQQGILSIVFEQREVDIVSQDAEVTSLLGAQSTRRAGRKQDFDDIRI